MQRSLGLLVASLGLRLRALSWMFCALFTFAPACTGVQQPQGSSRVVKKSDSEKEKQIRILEQALAESKLSSEAKDEVIRALREAPEADSAADQARILEAAQNAVLQKYSAEAAAVADLLTVSASLLARQVGANPEETRQLETELLQRAVDGLVQLGVKEADIAKALVRNTTVFAEGQKAPEILGVNPQVVAAAQEKIQQEKQFSTGDTAAPVVSSGIFVTDVQSTSAILHWGPALDDRTPFTEIRYRVLQSSDAADLSSLDRALALPAGAVLMPEAAHVLRFAVSGLVPGGDIDIRRDRLGCCRKPGFVSVS